MTDPGSQPVEVEVRPVPLRFWWLRRIVVVLAILVAGSVGLRVWWGHEAAKRFQAEIDRYRAAGQPVDLSDFETVPIDDANNAALVLERAWAALSDLTIKQTKMYDGHYGTWEVVTERTDEVARLLEITAEARTLVRRARSMPNADWGVPVRNLFDRANLMHLGCDRQLAKLPRLAAAYAHQNGNDADAVESLRDILGLGVHVGSQPVILHHLVALAIRDLAAGIIEDIAPGLEISDDERPAGGSTRPATRSQVKALIADLLDEGSLEQRRGFAWACYGDRALRIDWAKKFLAGTTTLTSTPGALGWAAHLMPRPVYPLDAVRSMRKLIDWADADERSSWPAWAPRSQPVTRTHLGLAWAARAFSSTQIPGDFRSATNHFHGVAFQRMAAVALAIRMYELDHGKRPERLDELVPEYLASVPKDPFTSDGRQIGYRPAAERPVLYSVNLDGIDEQGAFATRPGGWVVWDVKDLAFFLDGDRPCYWSSSSVASRPTSRKRDEDQPDVGHTEQSAPKDQRGKGQPQDGHE